MELPIVDSSEETLPPSELRIRKVSIDLYEDRRRVRISIELTAFRIPPDIVVMITDGDDNEIASSNIIGATNRKMSLTMHLPEMDSSSVCQLIVAVEYRQQGRVAEIRKRFSLANTSSLEEA